MATCARSRLERLRFWITAAASYLPPVRNRSVFVLGYPRPGTNWFGRIMSEYFGVPIYISEYRRLSRFGPLVIHLHRFFAPKERTFYVLRDGRDSVVSFYFKALNSIPESSRAMQRIRRDHRWVERVPEP